MVLLAVPALGHAAACRHPWAHQAAGPLRGVSSLLRQQLHPSLGWSLAFVSTNCCSWPLMAAGCWSTHPSEAVATGSASTAPCLLSSTWTPSESLRGRGCWLAVAVRSRGRSTAPVRAATGTFSVRFHLEQPEESLPGWLPLQRGAPCCQARFTCSNC